MGPDLPRARQPASDPPTLVPGGRRGGAGRAGPGVGSELLHHFTRQVDADAQPAYLETDRFENVALYEHFGFDVESEIRVRGVPVWRMWRDARSYPERL